MTTTHRGLAAYARLLRGNAPFRRLWLGEVTSYFGDWFNQIALYMAVKELGEPGSTGRAIAAVAIAKTLPAFLIVPVAGPLVDRFDRRRLLIAMDLARAGLVGFLLLAIALGSVVLLLSTTVLMVACAGLVPPAKNAILPTILPRAELPVANALAGGTWAIMLALGAAAGGWATEHLGIEAALVLDGLTFLVSAAFFRRLPPLRPPASRASRRETSFVEGLRYLARSPYVLSLMLLKPSIALTGGILVLLPYYGDGHWDDAVGAATVGGLFAARGVGALVGSIGVRTWVGDRARTLRRMIAVGFGCMTLGYLALSHASSYEFALLSLMLGFVGSGIVWVFSGTLLQWEGDGAYHGRIFSLEFGLHMLVVSVTSWSAGRAVDAGHPIDEICRSIALLLLVPLTLWTVVLVVTRARDAEESPP